MRINFPNPLECSGDLIFVGGDLSVENLLAAYFSGVFPWYSEGEPVLWYCLMLRSVLFPVDLHVARRLNREISHGNYQFSLDKAFPQVIQQCKDIKRHGQDGTWITEAMFEAYCELHRLGYAHSAEVWFEGNLAGGLYGISLGRCFFGESMFANRRNASKIAFCLLVEQLHANGFGLIDCQTHTGHLGAFGAFEIPKAKFLYLLGKELDKPTLKGNWGELLISVSNRGQQK